ncbi:lysine transporter LysE [Streptomyces sp. CB03234]|uniref:LysE family transporter n=1 Tax=Streptomyces sp. (strain CB03234) TaxID=1703937 RepID=UPI000939982E|nr:LysE family transporter [Streptomyces sp. CB03234]OKK02252.1 lysine transporter LysE [Streptomyces sp. CB03234]
MTGALVAGLLAGYGIAMPVGAVGAYLVALTARTSLRVGACAALGVATADGLYALVAAVGGAALMPFLQPVMVPLRWGSVVVLVGLAVRSGAMAIRQYRERQAAARDDRAPVGPLRAYLGLLGITVLNPMTVIYFAALVIGSSHAAEAPGALEQGVFVAAAFLASASWQLLLAGGGALLGRVLTGRRGRLVTALASSGLIIALAAHLLLSAP